jgi:hypothetical protein
MTSDENRWFEKEALTALERLPTSAWENMVALWRGLPSARPSTRGRILRCILEEGARRGDPWSANLVKRFAGAAIPAFVNSKARSRVHNAEAMQKAARYQAKHPKASLNKIAAAAGAPRDSIRQWIKRPDFKKYKDDAEFLIALDRGNSSKRLAIASVRLDRQHKKIRAARRRAKPPRTLSSK